MSRMIRNESIRILIIFKIIFILKIMQTCFHIANFHFYNLFHNSFLKKMWYEINKYFHGDVFRIKFQKY